MPDGAPDGFRRRLGLALSRPGFRFICILLLGLPFALVYAEGAVVIPWTLPSQIDFHPSWVAAVQISHGLSPYPAAVLQGRWQDVHGVAYVYPPLSAWLLQPLARIPYETAGRAWLIFQARAFHPPVVVLGLAWAIVSAGALLLAVIAILGHGDDRQSRMLQDQLPPAIARQLRVLGTGRKHLGVERRPGCSRRVYRCRGCRHATHEACRRHRARVRGAAHPRSRPRVSQLAG